MNSYSIPSFTGNAACAETDPDAFFPALGETTREAKRVCRGCEVREPCAEWGITHVEAGVWGGLSERERQRLRQRRRAAGITDEAGAA